jgi:zinc D-Ala-D-Ala dipeptidase
MKLIDLQKLNPRILLDIRYATANNFVGQPVYSSARCFLREEVAHKLDRIQKRCEARGLGLKVFDGYRPHFVQQVFWDLMPGSPYLADPAIGSKHNRGAAVDLTLVDRLGNELLMPSGFDDFTEKAHRSYMELPQAAIASRFLLESLMESEGFIPLPHEWWHFDDQHWENYPIENLSFEELEKG